MDLACGSGRHARFLARLGYSVTAVDREPQVIESVRFIQADLEGGSPWPLPGERFQGIVVTNYLHRPLFPVLADSLAPGGVLIYETFAKGNERFGKPSNPDFLLERGELLRAVAGKLRVVAFEDATLPDRVVQRIVAVRERP